MKGFSSLRFLVLFALQVALCEQNFSQARFITATAGTPQATQVGTFFPTLFRAVVRDSVGNGIPGVVVTFTAPSHPGTGRFPGDSVSVSRTTDSSGSVTAPIFRASFVAGSYFVEATVPGVALPALYFLRNIGGPPTLVTVVAGSPQATVVNSFFALPMCARVTDASGNPVVGAVVAFRAPPAGPSCGMSPVSGVTDANGIACIGPCRANSIAGSYSVVATVAGVVSTANFFLTNLPDVPASIVAIAGSGQSTPVNTRFPIRFRALVRDQFGNPVPYVAVTFTSSSSCGRFEGGDTVAVVTTDSIGRAEAPPFIAGGIPGVCVVRANVFGVFVPALFSVTILPGPLSVLPVELPKEFALGMNFPNPFNPMTTIPIAIPHTAEVAVKVYDMLGREIRTIFAGTFEAGHHFITWDGKNSSGSVVASGMYIARVATNTGKTIVGKMTLMK